MAPALGRRTGRLSETYRQEKRRGGSARPKRKSAEEDGATKRKKAGLIAEEKGEIAEGEIANARQSARSRGGTRAKSGGKGSRGRSLEEKSSAGRPKDPKEGEGVKKTRQFKRYFNEVKVDGLALKVGDIAYVDLGKTQVNLEEGDQCEICRSMLDDDMSEVMLECDGCLKGYHLGCLDPPLEDVPSGEWLCPVCTSSGARLSSSSGNTSTAPRTAREHFYAGNLGLVKIENFYVTGKEQNRKNGDVSMLVRWFYRPEDTHTGRQPHHGAREIFRTNHYDDNDVSCVVKAGAKVYSPHSYPLAKDDGDDVFFCEYAYDPAWQRFQRWSAKGGGDVQNAGSDPDFDLGSDSDGDASDDNGAAGQFDQDDDDYILGQDERKQRLSRKAATAGRRAGSCKIEQGGIVFSTKTKTGKSILALGAAEVPSLSRKGRKTRTPLDKAMASLTLSATPKRMPCREEEREQIEQFVKTSISSSQGSQHLSSQGRCLYISGVPGTGKTATVLEVMRKFRKKAESGDVPPFQFIELNALKLPTPSHAYTFLLEALTGEHASPNRAAEMLNTLYFSEVACSGSRKKQQQQRRPTILLVDEMDQLVTRSQSILYNIFEWPMHRNSSLSVIGIANTIDLPERFLPRVLSRLGLQRLAFQPYSQQQIQEIIRSRLENLDNFDKQAIEYVARKVAAVSGDVRRALELCRRGAEIAAENSERSANSDGVGVVNIRNIDCAIKEMFGASHLKLIQACSQLEIMMLGFLVLEMRSSGTFETTLERLVSRAKQSVGMIPDKSQHFSPSIAEMSNAVTQLSRMRIIIADPAWRHRQRKIVINVPGEDITHIISSIEDLKWMHKVLTS